jgi:hypothetical protein
MYKETMIFAVLLKHYTTVFHCIIYYEERLYLVFKEHTVGLSSNSRRMSTYSLHLVPVIFLLLVKYEHIKLKESI